MELDKEIYTKEEVQKLLRETAYDFIESNKLSISSERERNIELIRELIMCPHCGARLNRVGKGLLPTSCHECKYERFTPTLIKVSEVIENIKR